MWKAFQVKPEKFETGCQRKALPTPLRFVLASATAAAVNFNARMVLSTFLPYSIAIVIAFFCGMTTAFLLNRQFVFLEASNRLHQQIAWFVAINLLALVQTLGVSLLLAELLVRIGMDWHTREIAHAAGILVPIFTSYAGHRRWTFR